MLSILMHLEAMRLSILSFGAHLASLLLTSDVKGRYHPGGEGRAPPNWTPHCCWESRSDVASSVQRECLFSEHTQLAQCLTAKALCE
jgi:hypothetical protein